MARNKSTLASTPIRNLARLVTVSRSNYLRRVGDEGFNLALKEASVDRLLPLSRKQVEKIAEKIAEKEGKLSDNLPFTASDLVNLENGRSILNSEKLFWVLRGVGFSAEQARRILSLYNSTESDSHGSGQNPNIIHSKDRDVLAGSYGDFAYQRMYNVDADHIAPWVSCVLSDKGGFNEDEIFFRIDKNKSVELTEELEEFASKKRNEWAEARAANRRAPFNGPTLALENYFVDSTQEENSGERNVIRLNLIKSDYANNVAAKNSPEAEEVKWRHLSSLAPGGEFQPLACLASGIGIAVNVFCEGGRRAVLGQRSNLETFRSSEFDVAVVEGIRPDFNHYGETEDAKFISVHDAMWRGLEEELGLQEDSAGVLEASIFEFGCDLKFYQWNFLASVTLDLSFEEIERRWQRAKSRRENNFITAIEAERAPALEFVTHNPMWACGVACLLEAIRIKQNK